MFIAPCLLASCFLSAWTHSSNRIPGAPDSRELDKASRLHEAMLKPGSPPENCGALAGRCSIDVSGHYIEVANSFHITVTQHCCQLFLVQQSNPGVWAGMVLNRTLLVAGQTGYILSSSIKFANGMEWMKVASFPAAPTTTVPINPCAPALATTPALPTVPANASHLLTLPSTTKKPMMTKNQLWWAIGAGVAGAVGTAAVAGTAAAVIHLNNEKKQKAAEALTTLPPGPLVSRKSGLKVIQQADATPTPRLRARNQADGLPLNDGNTVWIIGFFLGAFLVMCVGMIGCAVMLRKRSKSKVTPKSVSAARSYSNVSQRSASREDDLLSEDGASEAGADESQSLHAALTTGSYTEVDNLDEYRRRDEERNRNVDAWMHQSKLF
jgi:hypothetical protein